MPEIDSMYSTTDLNDPNNIVDVNNEVDPNMEISNVNETLDVANIESNNFIA